MRPEFLLDLINEALKEYKENHKDDSDPVKKKDAQFIETSRMTGILEDRGCYVNIVNAADGRQFVIAVHDVK